jgi:hypothetical protein
MTVAFMFGPGLGAGLAQFTLQTPMFVSAAFAFVALVFGFFKFKDPKKPVNAPAVAVKQSTPAIVVNPEDENGNLLIISHFISWQ